MLNNYVQNFPYFPHRIFFKPQKCGCTKNIIKIDKNVWFLHTFWHFSAKKTQRIVLEKFLAMQCDILTNWKTVNLLFLVHYLSFLSEMPVNCKFCYLSEMWVSVFTNVLVGFSIKRLGGQIPHIFVGLVFKTTYKCRQDVNHLDLALVQRR